MSDIKPNSCLKRLLSNDSRVLCSEPKRRRLNVDQRYVTFEDHNIHVPNINTSTQEAPSIAETRQHTKWSAEEDTLLRAYVEGVGGKENVRWSKCSQFLVEKTKIPRSDNACRHRFNAHLAVTQHSQSQPVPTVQLCYDPAHKAAKTRSLGIQTEVSFPARQNVVWVAGRLNDASLQLSRGSILTSTPVHSTPVPAEIPSLRSLLLSPLDELETTNPGHVITNQDLTETHRRTDSLLCRQLFPSNTNMSSEQRQSDSCTDPDISSMQPSLAGMMSYSVSPALSSTLPSGNPNDHLYGKTKSKSTSRKKKKKKVKPGVAKLAQQLASVPESPVLTLKQRASINLGVKEGILSSDIAASVLSVPTVRSAVVQRLTEEISAVTGKMKNRKRGKLSTLMRKDFDAMQNCSLVEVVEEFHIKLPELFRLILGAMVRKNLDSETLRPLIPRLAMVYSILMQSRCPTLSRIQRVMSMSLADQICNQKVYDRLNKLGITLSYPRTLEVIKAVGMHYKDLLTEVVKSGKHVRLIGDNLNFEEGVTYETIDRHKHQVHMFASCALVTDPVFEEKPNRPEIPLRDITMDDVTLSPVEYSIMRDDIVSIVAEVLAKYLPQLKFHLETVPKRFAEPHPEYGKKTTVIPLPVLPLNEQFDKDTVKILDFYEGLLDELPFPTKEPIQIGGDQLTRERFGTAINVRLGNLHKRFAQLGPVTFEYFHLGMNYLSKMVFATLWNDGGEGEIGTLRGEKERVIRNSVDKDPTKAYEADKVFFINFVSAYLVEAALSYYGMESRNDHPTLNKPPENGSLEERKAWVYRSLGKLIDTYCFPHWSKNDNPVFIAHETIEEQYVVTKLADGRLFKVPTAQKNVTFEAGDPDRVKNYAHYVLESGLTFMYFLKLCKMPDRPRLLAVFKLMMEQLKSRNTKAKYPLELLKLLFMQYSLLSEQRANQVLHACFVNTKGKPESNVPADLQMEWVVKQNKAHIKHMFSNKSMDNIFSKSSALPGLHNIAANFDDAADVIVRTKRHNPKDIDKDEMQIMDDLRRVKPFKYQPGRTYQHRQFAGMEITSAKLMPELKLRNWFDKHKKAYLKFY